MAILAGLLFNGLGLRTATLETIPGVDAIILETQTALEEIGRQKGRTLDDRVVEACIEVFRGGDFALDEG